MAEIADVQVHIGELDLSNLDVDGEAVRQGLLTELRALLAAGHVLPDGASETARLGTATIRVERWDSPVDLGRQVARRLVGDVRRGWIPPVGSGPDRQR